jgi:hypothetical protein
MNAEKDMDLRVENESREFVGAIRHLIVKSNQQEMVEGDKSLHVKGNHLEKIDSDMVCRVGVPKVGFVEVISLIEMISSVFMGPRREGGRTTPPIAGYSFSLCSANW